MTVLFADLVGYTALSRELDAEALHLLLGRFFERIDGIIEEHNSHVDKHIRDCVMAVFGAPVAHQRARSADVQVWRHAASVQRRNSKR